MNLAITLSRASLGIQAPIVRVETHISNGLPKLNIVGLPETVVKESKDRVRSAILTSHFEFPSRRITINLAPADLPKQGGRYDLPIALGILAASKQIPTDLLTNYEFAGELALSGELRPIQGILPLALATKQANRQLILSYQNLEEAGLISDLNLLPANTLLEVCAHFLGKKGLTVHNNIKPAFKKIQYQNLRDVKSQHHAKRALEIAAAGGHSTLFIGSPGVGKTLISHCLPGILPPLTEQEAVEIAAIHSLSGNVNPDQFWFCRPFRSPHHSASHVALIGGGSPPKPGEISLAHNGVLFLDEFPEFKRQALEGLREPIESGSIAISRANFQFQYPARFQLIAAMNPCPCGNYGNFQIECICFENTIKNYQAKISGPLLDRIDLQVELLPLAPQTLIHQDAIEEDSEAVAKRVAIARDIQLRRANKPNATLSNEEIKKYCSLKKPENDFMMMTMHHQKFSARSFQKMLKIGRTIADLEGETLISIKHLKEALSYRAFEKFKKN